MKKIYIIRHCEAEGQPPQSQLTERGHIQAQYLTDFFSKIKIERIISSPFLRAIHTVEPLSRKLEVKIEVDDRLAERILSEVDLPDWFEKLKETFNDMELSFEGGESSNEATKRIVGVIQDILTSEYETTAIVTHGNIMALLLKNFDHTFGFEQWDNLSNPDVYLLDVDDNNVTFERLWQEVNEQI